ncbi:hypothetical protein [Giesbergeria anulus]|uniref:Uncharacterized protein n=1 Tax=Giesbergeria anulus TaxID=180197 RepID=A0A1H9NMA9_9BURK|nr:hypothetical protein [Giesbergeria anulus]SER37090.1 hypothetical protein SAMN02982919_02270 [Giesbergeria anulus]
MSKSNDTEKKNLAETAVRPPDINRVCGPAMQEAIEEVNKAFMKLCLTAARLGDSEPLAPALLGVNREVLDELANTGRAGMLMAQAYGLPLVECRFKDASVLRQVIDSGLGSAEAVAAITKAMPLDVITKGSRR